MRNEQGIFVGHSLCNNYRGVDRYGTKVCCGGRRVTVAYVKCRLKGVVQAEPHCSSSGCEDYRREAGLAMKAVSSRRAVSGVS